MAEITHRRAVGSEEVPRRLLVAQRHLGEEGARLGRVRQVGERHLSVPQSMLPNQCSIKLRVGVISAIKSKRDMT